VAGEVFESTRVVSALAELDGVESVFAPSEPGFGALAWGAAAHVAGIPMRENSRHGSDDFRALGGEPLDWSAVAAQIEQGARVAFLTGQSGFRSWDDRCILSRGDRGAYVPGQRVLWDDLAGGPGRVPDGLHPALATGSAAVTMSEAFHQENPSAAATDGRVRLVPVTGGPLMVLFEQLRSHGIRTLRSTRLQRSGCPVCSGADALAAAREAGVDLLVAGPWQIRP
jgi:hypothetical protein